MSEHLIFFLKKIVIIEKEFNCMKEIIFEIFRENILLDDLSDKRAYVYVSYFINVHLTL